MVPSTDCSGEADDSCPQETFSSVRKSAYKYHHHFSLPHLLVLLFYFQVLQPGSPPPVTYTVDQGAKESALRTSPICPKASKIFLWRA
jgi:hypothetical protein